MPKEYCKHCGCGREIHVNDLCPIYSVFEPEDEIVRLRRENAELKARIEGVSWRTARESPFHHNLHCDE